MPKREPTGAASDAIAEACAAALHIRALGRADSQLFAPIVAAVLKETARNRFPAAALLADLTAEFAEARVAVTQLAVDPRSHVRRRALRCLGRDTPPAFATEILRAALADADAGVRMKAASLVEFLGLTALLRTADVDPARTKHRTASRCCPPSDPVP